MSKAGILHKIEKKIDSNVISYPDNPTNGWYDIECKNKRVDFQIAERNYRATGSENDRLIMSKVRKEYRKCCRIKRRNYNVSKADNLLSLSKSNPSQFWKKIKTKKKQEKTNCNFFQYFKDLYDIDPAMGTAEEEEVTRW